jgi:hypothetical protein
MADEPGSLDGVGNAELGEDRFDAWRQRLPGPVPRKPFPLDDYDPQTLPRQPESRGGAGRAAPDDRNIGRCACRLTRGHTH